MRAFLIVYITMIIPFIVIMWWNILRLRRKHRANGKILAKARALTAAEDYAAALVVLNDFDHTPYTFSFTPWRR